MTKVIDYFYNIIQNITAEPSFGVMLTLLTYSIGVWLNRKTKTPLVNPMLVSVILIISVLLIFRIPYENYRSGGSIIELFLTPVTALLAVKIYEQLRLLKENWLPIFVGAAVGSAVSILCVILLCKVFTLDDVLLVSLLPKSVTTAIAVPLSEQNGGIVSVTVVSLVATGIMGAVFSPFFIKLLRIKNPVEAGIAIGTSSHALGTSKAIEIGDIEGAMSSCAIGIAGLITAMYILFI